VVNYGLEEKRILLKLKLFRAFAALSQAGFAASLSISHRTYQRIEAGESTLDLLTAIKIADILKIDLNSWLSLEEPKLNPNQTVINSVGELDLTNEERALVEMYLGLNDVAQLHAFSLSSHFLRSAVPACSYIDTKRTSNATFEKLTGLGRSSSFLTGFNDPQSMARVLEYLYRHQPAIVKTDPLEMNFVEGDKSVIGIRFCKYIDENLYGLTIAKGK